MGIQIAEKKETRVKQASMLNTEISIWTQINIYTGGEDKYKSLWEGISEFFKEQLLFRI